MTELLPYQRAMLYTLLTFHPHIHMGKTLVMRDFAQRSNQKVFMHSVMFETRKQYRDLRRKIYLLERGPNRSQWERMKHGRTHSTG